MLLFVMLITTISSLAVWGMTVWAIDLFGTRQDQLDLEQLLDPTNIDGQIGFGVIVLVSFAAGASMRLIYGHRGALWALLTLMICSGFWISIDFSTEIVLHLIAWMGSMQRSWNFPSTNELIMRLELYAMLMGVAAIGLVPGSVLHKMVLAGNRKRVRKIRRKLRKKMHRLD